MSRCLIVTPGGYDVPLEWRELNAAVLARHLAGYDRIELRPDGPFEVPPEYWTQRNYSPLLCSRGFYRQFFEAGYSHILILQWDAVVFRGAELAAWLLRPLDFIGAYIWTHQPYGRNGGLSLRRLDAFLEATEGRPDWIDPDAYWRDIGVNEDIYWSIYAEGHSWFRTGVPNDAIRFAWETHPDWCYALRRQELGGAGRPSIAALEPFDLLPFGAHGWNRHGGLFWASLGGVRRLALGHDADEDEPLRPTQ